MTLTVRSFKPDMPMPLPKSNFTRLLKRSPALSNRSHHQSQPSKLMGNGLINESATVKQLTSQHGKSPSTDSRSRTSSAPSTAKPLTFRLRLNVVPEPTSDRLPVI